MGMSQPIPTIQDLTSHLLGEEWYRGLLEGLFSLRKKMYQGTEGSILSLITGASCNTSGMMKQARNNVCLKVMVVLTMTGIRS